MKKILSLLLALTIVFALVACSNEKDTTSEPDTSTPTTQTETESTDTNDTQTSETDTTDENSSVTETPGNTTSTDTPSANTSKPTTSSKDNTASSKPSTSKPPSSTTTPSTSTSNTQVNTKITYTISYNANGGWGETASSSHIYNENRALSKNGFKRAGYTFVGWSTDSNATAAEYPNTQSVKNLTKTNGDVITLYAIWKESQTSQFDECKRAITGKKEVDYHATVTDNLGISHSDVAVFVNRDDVEKRYDERYTNGLFSKIKGTLYLSNEYTINQYTKIQLIIKADGAVVYKSDFFTKYSGSQSFEVDISGANIIEIYVADPISEYITCWNKGGDIIVENLTLVR